MVRGLVFGSTGLVLAVASAFWAWTNPAQLRQTVISTLMDRVPGIAATLEGDSRPLSFQGGNNPAFGPARGIVAYVPTDASASEATPGRIVTSGLGGVFPAGLFIGEITRLETSTDGLFKTGEVRLDSRLAELAEVTVLVPERAD